MALHACSRGTIRCWHRCAMLPKSLTYTFISPDAPSSKTPKHNMDTAAFSVVRVILDNERDLGSKYRWETKRAFHAIARHNRSATGSLA